jgi:glycosyltransferase involved in cell wall biosynthesis
MKKNIIIFNPSIEGGGVEKNLFIITNFLSKKINNIFVVTQSNGFRSKFFKKIKIKCNHNYSNKFDSRKIKYFFSIVELIKLLFKEKKNKNIVISFQANIYCLIICKIFKTKIILRPNSAPVGWSKNFFKRNIFKFFFQFADKIITNSYDFSRSLKENFGVESIPIYNPLNKHEIIKKSKANIKNYFKNKNCLKIINIGRLTPQKDQITLIKSLSLLKKNNIKFEALIIGRGYLKNQLINKIKENQLSKEINILNFTNNPYPALLESDILILTSIYEGLPNVLLEAAILKKFIISTNCDTGPREILDNGKGGMLFKIKDYKQLTKKIIYYLKNKKKLDIKIKHNYSRIYRFDEKKNLKKYWKIISENI